MLLLNDRVHVKRAYHLFYNEKDCIVIRGTLIVQLYSKDVSMKILLFMTTIFVSLFSNAYADVGCGPSPRPMIEKDADTADDTGESGDTGEEEQDSGEEAKWSPQPMRLAILFGPVIGLAFFARRRE